METNKITIEENGHVCVPENVRMSSHEIATLFDVYVQTANTHIKAVLKSGVIKTDISCPATATGNTILPDTYGLDMVIALAFRIHSSKTGILRQWLIRRVAAWFNPFSESVLIRLSKGHLYN